MQICPECVRPPNRIAFAAASRFASDMTMTGDLPPSSRHTGFKYLPLISAIFAPTTDDPVKLIFRTAGWAIMASHTAGVSPGATWTRLRTPGGRSASMKSWAAKVWIFGLYSDVFSMHVLPAMRALAKARTARTRGAFHAVISEIVYSIRL